MPVPDDFQPPSRSARKRAAQAVEDLARRLAELSEAELRRLPADLEILEEIRLVRSVPSRAARDRQVRHLAGLLRRQEEELGELRKYLEGIDDRLYRERAGFHRLEELRDRLCDARLFPAALEEVGREFPAADQEGVVRLARSAQGGDRKAFRELFRLLRRAEACR